MGDDSLIPPGPLVDSRVLRSTASSISSRAVRAPQAHQNPPRPYLGLGALYHSQGSSSLPPPQAQLHGAAAASAAPPPHSASAGHWDEVSMLRQRLDDSERRNADMQADIQNLEAHIEHERLAKPYTAGQWGIIQFPYMPNRAFEELCERHGGHVFQDGTAHIELSTGLSASNLRCLLPPAPARQRGDVDGGRFDSEAILGPIMDTVGAEFVRVQEELQQHHSDVTERAVDRLETAHGNALREAMKSLHSQNEEHADDLHQALTLLEQQQNDINRVYVVVVVVIILALASLACNVWGGIKEFVSQKWEQRMTEKVNNQDTERMKTPELMESGQLDGEVRVITHDC